MKIVFWNILFGFWDMSPTRYGMIKFSKYRYDNAIKVLTAINPDIVVLNEAQWYQQWIPAENNELKRNTEPYTDYAALFKSVGLDYCSFVNEQHEWGYAVGSRIPCDGAFKIRVPHGENAAGRFIFKDRIVIDTYHPHPVDITETQKMECFRYLIGGSPYNENILYLIGGDFNTVSVDPAPWGYEPEVIPFLKSKGLIDLITEHNPGLTSFPTNMIPVSSANPKVSLDHVYGNKQIKLLNSQIIQFPECDEVSDHYPLLVEVEKI